MQNPLIVAVRPAARILTGAMYALLGSDAVQMAEGRLAQILFH